MRKTQWIIGLLIIWSLSWGGWVKGQDLLGKHAEAQSWADSVLAQLSQEERIGQLFMIAAYSKGNEKEAAYIESLLKKYKIGGLIFMQGYPEKQVQLFNRFQKVSEVPLMIGQDAEWGLSFRLANTMRFPQNMTLGAIRNDSLIFEYGQELARQLKEVGVQVNFAPVVDINNNPNNPIIGYRSFGDDKYNVARKGRMLSQGMQEQGVLACLKHFPGHGDTDQDSHHTLPVIRHSKERLDTLELYPFGKCIEGGVAGVMIAHLFVPSLDTINRPTTLSPFVVKEMLRKRLNFEGLIFTDGLNMKGITSRVPPGKAELAAFLAGNDVLLFPANVPKAVYTMRKALAAGIIDSADLAGRVHRILEMKYKLGLRKYEPLQSEKLEERLHPARAKILKKRLFEAALTLARNEDNLLPLQSLEQSKVAYIQLGTNRETTFEKSLKKYTEVKSIHLPLNFSSQDVARLKQALKNYNRVIIGVFGLSKRRSIQYGLDKVKALSAYLKAADKPSILCLFDNPYALEYIGPDPAVLVAYEKASEAQQAAAMAIFGGLKVDGRLPISAGPAFPAGTGMSIERTTRFGFAFPEEEGVDSRVLNRIDSLAELFIKKGAMPGCAILVGKGNNIIYEKGFGKTHTRSGAEAIDPYYHTYDLASVTKVATTTLIAMKLVEEKRLKLDAPISNYLPELKGTDKAKITVRRLLQHNSGLPAWRPFYRDTYLSPRNPKNDPRFYRTSYQDSFNLPIAPQLFAHYSLPDTIWDWIKGMSVRQSRKVRYSDIGMIMLGKVIEAQTGVPIDRYAHFAYYSPLGMSSTYYTPGLRGLENRCPPTIEDNYWRHGRLQGYVHDETAAILGGRTGHAGLFSNVYDLAKLFFMLKNGGTYGNRQFLRESTILSFTKQQLGDNRKGLGWDKPEIVPGRSNPVSEQASRATFGHTGFTGTCAWVDPEQDLVYIFLSNRTYPSASNRMLNRESVRSKIMDQIYDAIKAYEEKEAS